jgi:predicted SAM-dependent methyltransferase
MPTAKRMKTLREELETLSSAWIEGTGENDIPEELKAQELAKIQAYKDAGETLKALLKEYETDMELNKDYIIKESILIEDFEVIKSVVRKGDNQEFKLEDKVLYDGIVAVIKDFIEVHGKIKVYAKVNEDHVFYTYISEIEKLVDKEYER